MTKCVPIVLLMAALAGCAGFHRDTPSAQFYVLRAAPVAASNVTPPAASMTLRVSRTVAAPGLDSDNIVLMRSDHRMDFFAASRWAAPLTDVVESLAVETLRGTGAWAAVNDSQGAFSSEYYLQISIRRFEADYTAGGNPVARVTLDCSIGRRAERDLLAGFVAEGSVPAAENRVSAVVDAFEKAANAALAIVAQRSAAAVTPATR